MAVRLEKLDGTIALVTLDRPEARNAISHEMALALETIVSEVESDDGIRVAIITGRGPVFSAGADLREVSKGELAGTFTEKGGFAGFVNAPRQKIWIAAVNGPALAGGFEIVLACDLVVSLQKATFGLPEVRRGLIASAGGLYRLPRSLPKAIAFEVILTGGAITAEKAKHFGLINIICEEDVVGAALELAQLIGRNAPLALKESVRIAREATGFENEILQGKGDRAQARLSTTADYAEGSRAFVEKRSPLWQGQ